MGYNEDWYALELEKSLGENKTEYSELIKNINYVKLTFDEAYEISKKIQYHYIQDLHTTGMISI